MKQVGFLALRTQKAWFGAGMEQSGHVEGDEFVEIEAMAAMGV